MKRDLQLDAFRGIFLVVMTLNHWPGQFPRYFNQPLGLASAAEGFVFVSGLTAGLVYSRMAENQGLIYLRSRAFRRAREIYQTHFFFLALIFLLGLMAKAFGQLPASWAEQIPFLETGPLRGITLGALLVFQPKFFNILPLYILLLFLTPVILGGFTRGHGGRVLALSGLVWIFAQLGLTETVYAYLTRDLGFPVGLYFDPLAWQFLFVLGMWVGYQRYRGSFRRPEKAWLLAICLAAALILGWFRYQIKQETYPIDQILGVDMSNWISRPKLGPLRLFNFFILVYIITTVTARFPRLFIGRWFRYLGRHSLQVFSFHLLLTYLAYAVRDWGGLPSAPGPAFLASILGAVSLTLPAWLGEKIGRRPFMHPRDWSAPELPG